MTIIFNIRRKELRNYVTILVICALLHWYWDLSRHNICPSPGSESSEPVGIVAESTVDSSPDFQQPGNLLELQSHMELEKESERSSQTAKDVSIQVDAKEISKEPASLEQEPLVEPPDFSKQDWKLIDHRLRIAAFSTGATRNVTVEDLQFSEADQVGFEEYAPKHYHEYKHDNHLDARFAKDYISDDERKASLDGIISAWSAMTRENDILSWVAHGSLIGFVKLTFRVVLESEDTSVGSRYRRANNSF